MTTKKLFGTDGIRGHINSINLQPENMTKLGRVLGHIVKNRTSHESLVMANQASIVIGRDTRASGVYLEQAIIAGITSMGVSCELVGILPTAAIAYYTKQTASTLGVVISASHNPFHDNGLKLFDPLGFKISETLEEVIEEHYHSLAHYPLSLTPGQAINRTDAAKIYGDMILTALKPRSSFKGLKVVLDCAHGAASSIASQIFLEVGLDVHLIGVTPDGNNINRDCGSEWPEKLKGEVMKHKADLGVAFDGDADRVVIVDERGQTIDGDAVLAVMAIDLKHAGQLAHDTVVATVMSSVALDKSLADHGIRVVRTQVGDKYVTRKMVDEGYTLGGENSGHLIVFPRTTTGDGIFSGLKFIDILHRCAMSASKLVSFYKKTPTLLTNIEVADKIPLDKLPKTQGLVVKANDTLKNLGRVMLRYSGTENKVRLLVEAPTIDECQRIADAIATEFNREINVKYV